MLGTRRRQLVVAAVGAALVTPMALAAPAMAKGPEVRAGGVCSPRPGVWELKAHADDGRIEIEFEVDTNRVGQVWNVRITDNGATVLSGNRRTTAPSGSFEVEARPVNRPGRDVIVARATRGSAVCVGRVTL